MKDFFRHPVIGIDRILSSGIKWQLLFLLGVIVAAILVFIVIEWLTGSILTIKENDPRNIFVDVYYHFAKGRGIVSLHSLFRSPVLH